MRYIVTSDFIKINETAGIIQNTSSIYALEVSNTRTKDSGVLVYNLHSVTFKGSPVYIRCVEENGFIDVRVLSFDNVTPSEDGASAGNFAIFDANGAIVDSGFTVASDADINTMLINVFGASTAG